ncbi:hypothetical protein L1887_32476 [Cichorium endivia]|nr:hypothetical protein L1887_32476 [Cichorium endivia]
MPSQLQLVLMGQLHLMLTNQLHHMLIRQRNTSMIEIFFLQAKIHKEKKAETTIKEDMGSKEYISRNNKDEMDLGSQEHVFTT